jgi:hypothetical protein
MLPQVVKRRSKRWKKKKKQIQPIAKVLKLKTVEVKYKNANVKKSNKNVKVKKTKTIKVYLVHQWYWWTAKNIPRKSRMSDVFRVFTIVAPE